MWSFPYFTLALSSVALASSIRRRDSSSSLWNVNQFQSFLTFGDSYTDENRLNYFAAHNGSAPPPGTLLPENTAASSGGRIWARYVIQYTSEALTLYDYAVNGAVCSNNETPRLFSTINAPFPDVDLYEVPAFIADKTSNNIATGQPYFTPALNATNAVYAMYIGTNDLGNNAYLTDSQIAGNNLVSYTDCVFTQLDRLYSTGARYFVLLNIVPLDLAPLYANDTAGGVGANKFWPDKPDNHTAIAEKMMEQVATVNAIFSYRTPYEVGLAGRYPGAEFALFDVHRLFMDIYTNPTAYLNGSAPANVTSFENQCDVTGANCVVASSPDSFFWYDELHPSEQTDRILAEEFVAALNGNGTYATYFSG